MIRNCLQAADIQRITGLSEGKVYELLHREDFPSIQLGRRIIVPAEAFERWLMREAGENMVDEHTTSAIHPGR